MSKYIVTGGAGFIGSNITKRLVGDGHQVKVIDNLITGKRENLKDLENKIEFIKGDIRDTERMKQEFRGFDYVLHQAALPSVPRSVDNPIISNDHNINGTLSVLTAAREVQIKRLVYASSSSVYGNSQEREKNEEIPPNPLSPYALTKLAGEYYCKLFYKLYGLETVILRYFNVFGPFQDPKSEYAAVIPKFITCILKDKPPIIYGDGRQSRDFTFVENNVQANILACEAKDVSGEIFNIACNDTKNLLELVEIINMALGKSIEPIFKKARIGDVKHSCASIKKAEKMLGYRVIDNFETGLKKSIKWYKERSK
ncbi:MAG: SDR family oxidoreductase [Patescibacteria group bacterium]